MPVRALAAMGWVSLYDVQELRGHQCIAMPQCYAHLSDNGLKEATAGFATVLDEAA